MTLTPLTTKTAEPLRIEDTASQKAFVLAGKAIFTVLNTESQKRATYRVEAIKGEENAYEVRGFTGSENGSKSNYDVLGTIRNGRYTYRSDTMVLREMEAKLNELGRTDDANFVGKMAYYTRKGWDIYSNNLGRMAKLRVETKTTRTKIAFDDAKQKGFFWLWNTKLANDRNIADQGFEFWHEGRCGCCGKLLTVPESISAGYGPVCLPRMGLKESKAA
jgi:hypothetical protein